jgi:hypothetical protein
MMYESALKTYGARFESGFSERTVFSRYTKMIKPAGYPATARKPET